METTKLHLSEIDRRCRESANEAARRRTEAEFGLLARLKPIDYVGAAAFMLLVVVTLFVLKLALI